MGGITVTLEGARELQAKLNRVRTMASTNARRVVTTTALTIQRDLRRKLSEPGGGNTYRRGRKVHTASAPGQPPAVDTGRLRNSVAPFFFRGGLAAEVGTRLTPYPAYLEEGTPGGMIAPRPWLSPVWREAEPQYLLDMAAALKMLERVT